MLSVLMAKKGCGGADSRGRVASIGYCLGLWIARYSGLIYMLTPTKTRCF